MNIVGKQIKLRAIEEEDLKKLHEWSNDPGIWDMLGGWHFPYSLESQKKWFQSLDKDAKNQRYAIETNEGVLIGTIALENIDWKNNHASLGLMIGEKEMRGKGFAFDVQMTIHRYAFDELHFERLSLEIIEYNDRSVGFAQKCGFKEEGRMRHWYFRKGRYWDLIAMGITKADHIAFMDQSKYWPV